MLVSCGAKEDPPARPCLSSSRARGREMDDLKGSFKTPTRTRSLKGDQTTHFGDHNAQKGSKEVKKWKEVDKSSREMLLHVVTSCVVFHMFSVLTKTC